MDNRRGSVRIPEQGGGPLGDGRTLYRALARQIIGDPSEFTYILGEVLHHYLRIWLNAQHPLHQRYHSLDQLEFYKFLSKPDSSGSLPVLNNVLEVVSNALRSLIILENGRVSSVIGTAFSNHVRCQISVQRLRGCYRFTSLVTETSGRALIDRLIQEKAQAHNSNLTIKEMRWWWDPQNFGTLKCANEFALPNGINSASPRPPVVGRSYLYGSGRVHPRIFSVFVVSVKEANQIRPAVDLLEKLLPLGPGQGVPVNIDLASTNANKAILRPYVGVDAEFKFVSNRKMKESEYETMSEDTNDTENLCTILSIAIDRHVTFCFHILHMLENRDRKTVDQLRYLWERIIFNNEILKIWFNFQSDINVLDATIANSYQGNPRPPYWTQPYQGEAQRIVPQPKLGSLHLSGTRPDSLKFPTQDEAGGCVFHRSLGLGQFYPRNIACPCRTGNLDIETIISRVRGQLELGEDYEFGVPPRRLWTENRRDYSYEKLLGQFLQHDWVYDLLKYFKDRPGTTGAAFYRSFGPSIESDSDKMGYNIGDVVGIALIVRILTTTDDRRFLLACLRDVSENSCQFGEGRTKAQTPFNEQTPHAGDPGIPLIDDNPRSWSTKLDRIWKEDLGSKTTQTTHWQMMELSKMVKIDSSYVTREKITNLLTTKGSGFSLVEERERLVKRTLHDPLRFVFPKSMTTHQPFHMKYNRPVVQTTEYYYEDLLRRIGDAESRNSRAPTGLHSHPPETDCLILSKPVKEAFMRHRRAKPTHENIVKKARKTLAAVPFADYVEEYFGQLELNPARKLGVQGNGHRRSPILRYDELEKELCRFERELRKIDDAYLVKLDDPLDVLGGNHASLLADNQNIYERTPAFDTRTPLDQLRPSYFARIVRRRQMNNAVRYFPPVTPNSNGDPNSDSQGSTSSFLGGVHRSDGKTGGASRSINRLNVVTRSMARRLVRKRPASGEMLSAAKKTKKEE